MLYLLIVPVLLAVATAHKLLALYAPSNVLIARARMTQPRWRNASLLAAFAMAALVLMHLLTVAVSDGACGGLNLVVLVLAWDSIKFGLAAAVVATKCLASVRPVRRYFTGGGRR